MWIEFMQTALKNTHEEPVEQPEGIIKAYINPKSGLLVSDNNGKGVWEFFQADHLPNKAAKTQGDSKIDSESPNESTVEDLF
jgi:penicillin-binding protein 1A